MKLLLLFHLDINPMEHLMFVLYYNENDILCFVKDESEAKSIIEKNNNNFEKFKEYNRKLHEYLKKYMPFFNPFPRPVKPTGPSRVDPKSEEWKVFLEKREEYNNVMQKYVDMSHLAYKDYLNKKEADLITACGKPPRYYNNLRIVPIMSYQNLCLNWDNE